ncbi:hypothetical protein ULMS_05930 [Patiriisocius marinistellae]|uniref:Uncharacterized protein n=1 Tax=Patiriisocius marinistellae TaxID=2494560 RepID=A0A5J4FYH6_9FLAO|nr:DUF5995 family protein [Patiriisocius marinistellae]GEQ85085.1 hypothetical protein ULMS_05930 [Patiriisocius marinistellae]
MRLAKSINEVIEILNEIIAYEVDKNSAMAFFPVLYKKVTERIRDGILNSDFQDNPRMERLDVLFANRYLEAYYNYKAGKKITNSWLLTFEATKDDSVIILQHILLGINAHINLDLGIVASQTVGNGVSLDPFREDYDKINDILSTMVQSMQTSVNKVSPLLILLEWIGKGKEDKLAAFSISIARDGSWVFSNQYHSSLDQPSEILKRDKIIAILAAELSNVKSKVLRFGIKIIRFFESKEVKKVAQSLENA